MKFIVVGSGKLSNSIQKYIDKEKYNPILKWNEFDRSTNEKVIIIHAASGRELDDGISYCQKTKSVLIEMSTGSKIENTNVDFPVFICPNTSLLLCKLMRIIKLSGKMFKNNKVKIIESHQEDKKSLPGTAASFANSLHVPINEIVSIRKKEDQLRIGIDEEHLDLHAYHKIIINGNDDSEIIIETKVCGHQSYVKGLENILDYIMTNRIKNTKYSLENIIEEI
jgi:4-hydroxy-tetrahydrodipicolinate reductase